MLFSYFVVCSTTKYDNNLGSLLLAVQICIYIVPVVQFVMFVRASLEVLGVVFSLISIALDYMFLQSSVLPLIIQ